MKHREVRSVLWKLRAQEELATARGESVDTRTKSAKAKAKRLNRFPGSSPHCKNNQHFDCAKKLCACECHGAFDKSAQTARIRYAKRTA